jgi:hypothetical protein
MVAASVELNNELVDFLQSGVSILVATRDASFRPQCLRAMGAIVDHARSTFTLYLPEAVAGATLENLRENGQIAVTFSRPIDHRSVQLKGTCGAVRPSEEHDRAVQERYRAAFVEQLHAVGLPRTVSSRIRYKPSIAVEVTVAELYEQTPGPGAGRRLGKTGL